MKYRMHSTEAQDRHLDLMLRLAFAAEEEEAVQHILNEPDPTLSAAEKAAADRAFAAALAASEKNTRLQKRRQRSQKAKRLLARAVQAAACLVLIAAVAMPVAIAHSPALRAKIMQLMMQLDAEKGEAHFTFEETEQTLPPVPEGWSGRYYPAYIPQGFQVYAFDPAFAMVEYRNGDAHQLYFSENDADAELWAGTDGSSVEPLTVGGQPGYIIDGVTSDGITHTVTVVWQCGDRWFQAVTFGIDTAETLRVVNSVRQLP